MLITARGRPNQTISLCCLDRHLPVKWKYDESSVVIHHFPPRCSLLPLTSHLTLLCILLWILNVSSPFYSRPVLYSGSTSSSPRLLSLTSATCLLFDLSPHFHLLTPFVCVHPLLPLLFQLTFPFISHFPPHLHPLSASPYLSPPSSPVTFNFPRYPLHSGALSSLHPQVQYSAYVGVGGLFSVVKLFCGGLLFWFMVKCSLGRKLLTMVGTLFISRPSFCYLPPNSDNLTP